MTTQAQRPGILFVVSAPSGTGKSTIVGRLLREVEGLHFSVSYTTRGPRPGEVDGREYHFVSPEQFGRMVDEGAFLEWAEVFGRRYGTGLEETRRALGEGADLLLEIDTAGAAQVRRGPVACVSVMILPPDYATLRARLVGRGSEGTTERDERLGEARREIGQYAEFDYVVINDRLEDSVAEIAAVVRAERLRTARRQARVRAILESFSSDTNAR